MNNPIKQITLDVNKAQNYETLTVKQGDENSRTYKITLTSGGQMVTLAAGDTVQAKAERGGKTVALVNCQKSGNEITLTLPPAALAVAGDLRVEIIVYSGAAKLTSATQIFKVARSIGESPIVESPDFSALTDTMKEFTDAIGKATDSTEVIAARGSEALLPDRLRKIESGERINQGVINNKHLAYNAVDTMELADGAVTAEKIAAEAVGETTLQAAAVTEEKIASDVMDMFSERIGGAENNLYDATSPDYTAGKYYSGGKQQSNDKIDSMFFTVSPGDKISASGFKFTSKWSTVGGGVRTAFFNGTTWVKDLIASETYNKDFVVVPDGVTRVSIPYWIDDPARSFYNYGHTITAMDKIEDLKGDIYKIEYTAKNLYNNAEVMVDKYYKEGKLISNIHISTMPLIAVLPGDKIYASGFDFYSSFSQAGGGIRVGFYYNGVWVKDLLSYDTYKQPYIVVPDGVNQVAIPYWEDDHNRTLYNLSSPDTEEIKTSAIEAVTRAEKRIDTLAEMIGGRLNGKRVCIYGDSISTFAGFNPSGNITRYPLSGTLTDVNETWWKLLIDNNGATLGINESWAGIRVAWDGKTTNTYQGKDIHLAAQARIDKLGGNGKPDYIFVFGGTNDVNYREVPIGTFDYTNPVNLTDAQIVSLPVGTFADAYRTMLIRLLKTYQTSKVIVILPLYTSKTDGENLDKYNEIIKEACDFFGVPFIDLRTAGITMFNRQRYQPDGVHPNTDGMRLIYECIQRSL